MKFQVRFRWLIVGIMLLPCTQRVQGDLFCSTDTPQAIADWSAASSTLSIADAGYVKQMQVRVHIDHPDPSDLKISLINPQGFVRELLRYPTEALGSSCLPAPDFVIPVIDPYGLGPDADFAINHAARGDWQLWVEDSRTGNAGTLECWCLDIEFHSASTYCEVLTNAFTRDFPIDHNVQILAEAFTNGVETLDVSAAQLEVVSGPNTGTLVSGFPNFFFDAIQLDYPSGSVPGTDVVEVSVTIQGTTTTCTASFDIVQDLGCALSMTGMVAEVSDHAAVAVRMELNSAILPGDRLLLEVVQGPNVGTTASGVADLSGRSATLSYPTGPLSGFDVIRVSGTNLTAQSFSCTGNVAIVAQGDRHHWQRELEANLDNRKVQSFYDNRLSRAIDIEMGDLDGDGDVDLFQNFPALSFLENIGSPRHFVPAQPVAVEPNSFFRGFGDLADLDFDGDLDFVIADSQDLTTGGLLVFANDEDANSGIINAAPYTHTYGGVDFTNALSVTLYDVTDDGLPDLFLTTDFGEFLFFPFTGTAAEPAFGSPIDIYSQIAPAGYPFPPDTFIPEFGDIDGDGLVEMLLAVSSGFDTNNVREVWLIENSGTRSSALWDPAITTFYTPVPAWRPRDGANFSQQALKAQLADPDNDGDLDLFLISGNHQNILLAENIGTAFVPSFAGLRPWLPTARAAFSEEVRFADFDGDGDPDAYSSMEYAENIGSLNAPVWSVGREWTDVIPALTNSVLGFAPDATRVVQPVYDPANGVDLLYVSGASDLSVFHKPHGASEEAWIFSVPTYAGENQCYAPEQPQFGDYDGDGDMDMVDRGGVFNGDCALGDPYSGVSRELAFAYLENVGNSSNPVFQLPPLELDYDFEELDDLSGGRFEAISTDFLQQNQFDVNRVVDYDGDGLLDRIVTLDQVHFLSLNRGVVGDRPEWGSPIPVDLPNRPFGDQSFNSTTPGAWSLVDLDADGDQDVFVDGLSFFFRNGSPSLVLRPNPLTAGAGEQVIYMPSNQVGATRWRLAQNVSGGQIDPTNGVYIAGAIPGIDIVEATDAEGVSGRAFVNVIDVADLTQSGKAIIVAGAKSLDDPVWRATDRLAQKAYNTLRLKGFAKQNIQYLSFEPGRDIDGNGFDDDIDGAATVASVQDAIQNFAANSDRLFLYLCDHGSDNAGDGFMRLNPAENLNAGVLDAALDALQNAQGTRVSLVMDFCFAGSFLDQLTYPGNSNRLAMASCNTNELTYFIAEGQVSYSQALFNGLLQGQTLGAAHRQAADAMSVYQTAILDDNHDGVATITDGMIADQIRVGASISAGRDIPQIGKINSNQKIEGDVTVTLFMDELSSVYPIRRTWCVIFPPNHAASVGRGEPVIDLPELDLFFNEQTGRYEADFNGFTAPGSYAVIFFAEDIWGSVSFPKQSYITQSGFKDKLIVVAGGPDSLPDWPDTDRIARNVHETFRLRSFDADSIYYLSPSDPVMLNGTNVFSATSTAANLEQAISSWAADADRLTLYLVGTGTNDTLQLNATEYLDGAHLDLSLDQFQLQDRQVNVVMDFSGSGGFLEQLSVPPDRRRILIASSDANRRSVLSNGRSFSDFFLSELFLGKTVGQAATAARKAVRRISGNLRQKVFIDDNGNNLANEKVTSAQMGDGLFAARQYIGSAFLTGDDLPNIGAVTRMTVLSNATSMVLYAEEVTDVDGIAEVWCEITPPTNSLAAVSILVPLTYNPGNQRWEQAYNRFDLPGEYALTFIAEDIRGNRSPVVQSQVLKLDPLETIRVEVNLPDSFEPDNVLTNASLSDIPAVQYHTLHTSNDCDWVRFFATDDNVYDIETIHQSPRMDTVIEIYRDNLDGTASLIDTVDEFGIDEGELAGLDFPQTGFYFVRVCQAADEAYQPGGYVLVIYVPAGFQGVNIYAWDVINNVPISGASVSLSGSNGTTDGNGVVRYPSAGRGSYSASVSAPGGNQYVPLYGTRSASDTSANANSVYGNARSLSANSFGTVAYSGVSLADTTYMIFGFVPVSYVTGSVQQETYGLPVEDAFIGFYRTGDNALFRAYPWASYGTPWLTDGSGSLPSETILLPNTTYRMEIIRNGYEPLIQNITTPARGGTLDLGNLDARLLFGGNAIPDIWEQFYGLPTNVNENADADFDTMSHMQEFIAGTDPTDPASRFVLPDPLAAENGDVTIRWLARANRRYRVLRAENLTSPITWSSVYEPVATSADQVMEYIHSVGDGKGYFQVDVRFP
jgi:subtilisin-like proprotein convertase family protein